MAASARLPAGFRFRPTDEELVWKLYRKVTGTQTHDHEIQEHDLYAPNTEPSDIWKQFGGQNLEKNQEELELFFFTRLKRVSSTGSRIKRTIGGGCWKGDASGKSAKNVLETKTMKRIGIKKTFHYKNKSDKSKDNDRWVLHELSLDKSPPSPAKIGDMVVCRLRKHPKKEEIIPSTTSTYIELLLGLLLSHSREKTMAPFPESYRFCPTDEDPESYRFCPTDEDLLLRYLYPKVKGTRIHGEDGLIHEHDLYAPNTEPWKIWETFGGPNLEENQEELELFFFTRLKRVSSTDTRIKRTIGKGCWKGDATGKYAKDVLETTSRTRIGFKKTFHYKSDESKDNNRWILHELSLDNSLLSQAEIKDLVVYRLRKRLKKEELTPHTTVSSPATNLMLDYWESDLGEILLDSPIC